MGEWGGVVRGDVVRCRVVGCGVAGCKVRKMYVTMLCSFVGYSNDLGFYSHIKRIKQSDLSFKMMSMASE